MLAALALPRPGTAQTVALSLRSRAIRPGEVLAARVAVPRSVTAVALAAFGQRWPAYQQAPTAWQALIGIDLDTVPGPYTITVTVQTPEGPSTTSRAITVLPRQFRTRTLTVAPRFVEPPPDVQARIVADTELLRAVYANSSDTPTWIDGMARPVRERANSSFGTRSVFNGQRRNPHAGTDFLSPAGTPVRAPAGGRIVVARDLFFTGNTVVIDHGLGVFSMLAHLSRVDVHDGDMVDRGVAVGLVGATGRVTGPHLHWALRVGDARVDALSALATIPASR